MLAYINLPITRTGQIELVLDTEHPTLQTLKLDFAGDGHIEIITPTVQSPAASADTTSPTTTMTIQGNFVTLTAIDEPAGSGVLRTYYSTDVEPEFNVYEGSFSLPTNATTLTAFSVDRNGNWESPGVTISFGQRIFLPLITR